MTLSPVFGSNKQILKKIRVVITSTSFIVTALIPQYAFAFEAPTATQDLRAPIDIINQSNTPKEETLSPTYTVSDAGPVVTPAPVPVTTPKPIPKRPAAITLPTSTAPLVMEGEASYYSRAGCLGCNPLFVMANGQVLDDNALTMAIGADKKHLVGHTARVTSLATGKSVNVRITDTGGFYKDKYGNRVADLTIATKEAIGMRGGVGQVRVEVF